MQPPADDSVFDTVGSKLIEKKERVRSFTDWLVA